MKRVIFFLLLSFFSHLNGQTKHLNGLYINNMNNAILCIKNDTLSLIEGTMGLTLSSFIVQGDRILLNQNIIDNKTSYIEKFEGEVDKIRFSLFYINKKPIEYANIWFIQNEEIKLSKMSDNNGCFLLDSHDIKQLDTSLCVDIKVYIVGFSTIQSMCLQIGKSYAINAKLIEGHPLDISSRNFKISVNPDNPNEIVIKRLIKYRYCKKWKTKIFTKTGECNSCLGLFEQWHEKHRMDKK